MVLIKEKLIFIHIPKTGGVSIEEYLQLYYGHKRNAFLFNHGFGTYLDKFSNKHTIYPHMHYPLRRINDELIKNQVKVDNSWTIFSIVRNPYNRFLSELFYNENKTNGFRYNYFTLPENQRGRYLNQCLDHYLNNDIHDNYHSNHTLPQYKFFEDTDLTSNIFKFEDGLENALIHLGFDAKNKVQHHLNSFNYIGVERPNYEDIYTRYFIETINNLYQKDFQYYDYKILNPNDYPLIN